MAIAKWKQRVGHAGVPLGNGKLPTNLRYADDMMLCAQSADESANMLEVLMEELAAVGLHLNPDKTKILTTEETAGAMFIEVENNMLKVMNGMDTH
eukprot:4550014-Pyramimonas_sp.AAC.1